MILYSLLIYHLRLPICWNIPPLPSMCNFQLDRPPSLPPSLPPSPQYSFLVSLTGSPTHFLSLHPSSEVWGTPFLPYQHSVMGLELLSINTTCTPHHWTTMDHTESSMNFVYTWGFGKLCFYLKDPHAIKVLGSGLQMGISIFFSKFFLLLLLSLPTKLYF